VPSTQRSCPAKLHPSTTASNQPIHLLTDRVLAPKFCAMAGLAHIDSPLSKAMVLRVRGYQLPMLAGAVLCLFSAWYFALVIAPSALNTSSPTVQQGLLPEWLGCREILHGRDPYRVEVTQQAELAIYGETVSASSPANQHRFAYPTENTFLESTLPRSVFSVHKLARCGQFEGEFATMGEELKIPSFKFFSVCSVPSVVKTPCTYTSSEKLSRLVSMGTPAACSFSENLGTMPVA